MARLVRQHAAVQRPGAAPRILVVILLPAAPAHAHRAEHELAEASGVERLAQLDDRHVEAVLLHHEQPDAVLVAGADHLVGVVERQRHRLLDDDVLAVGREPIACSACRPLSVRMTTTSGDARAISSMSVNHGTPKGPAMRRALSAATSQTATSSRRRSGPGRAGRNGVWRCGHIRPGQNSALQRRVSATTDCKNRRASRSLSPSRTSSRRDHAPSFAAVGLIRMFQDRDHGVGNRPRPERIDEDGTAAREIPPHGKIRCDHRQSRRLDRTARSAAIPRGRNRMQDQSPMRARAMSRATAPCSSQRASSPVAIRRVDELAAERVRRGRRPVRSTSRNARHSRPAHRPCPARRASWKPTHVNGERFTIAHRYWVDGPELSGAREVLHDDGLPGGNRLAIGGVVVTIPSSRAAKRTMPSRASATGTLTALGNQVSGKTCAHVFMDIIDHPEAVEPSSRPTTMSSGSRKWTIGPEPSDRPSPRQLPTICDRAAAGRGRRSTTEAL